MMPIAADSSELAPLPLPFSAMSPATQPSDQGVPGQAGRSADDAMVISFDDQALLAVRSAAIISGNTAIPCRVVPRSVTTQPNDQRVTSFELIGERADRSPILGELIQGPNEATISIAPPRDKSPIELAIETLGPMPPVCLTPREPDRILNAAVGSVAGHWFDGLFDPLRDLALTINNLAYYEELPDRTRITVVTPRDYEGKTLAINIERDYLKTRHGLAGYAPLDRSRTEPMPAAWMPFAANEPPSPDEITRNTIWMAVNLKPYGAASVLTPQPRTTPRTGPPASAPAARARRPAPPPIGWDYVQRSGTEIAGSFWGRGLIAQSTSSSVVIGSPLTLPQACMFASLLGLAGQSPIAGEQMYQLTEERVDLLRRIIPAVPVRTVDLFPHHEWPPVWNVAIATDAGRWNIVGLFNTSDEPRVESVELEDLHLGNGVEQFAVYDVWGDRLIRVVTDRFQLRVPPTGCRVLAITALREDRPVILGTSRHIMSGVPDLRHVRWNAETLTLIGQSDVVARDPYDLRLYLPGGERGLAISQIRCGTAHARLRGQDRLRSVTLDADTTGPVDWQISFARVGQAESAGPGQPRNVTTRQNTRGVLIEWSAPDETAVGYRVYRDLRLLAEAESCEFQDSTATYNSSFQYTVTAVDARGNESVPSESVTHQTPMPASTNLTQLVPLTVSQDGLAPGQDRGVTGGPLRIANQRVYRGLGTLAPSRVVYFLGGGYDQFTGVVGIDDAAGKRASAVFRIVADGQNLFTSPPMRAGQPAVPFNVRVRAKTQLELITTPAETDSDPDYGIWGNPYLRASGPE
jgi:hypothetical protein